MPYRGLERSGPACYRHDAAAATETCSRCRKAICDLCLGFEYTRPHCPPCARRVQARRKLGRRVTGALTVAISSLVVAGLGVLALQPKPFDYGSYTPEVRINQALLDGTPCDRSGMLRLSQAMLRAGDDRGTLEKIGHFTERCGEWPRLLWVSYSAHMRLADFNAAMLDASRLITLSPNDKDFWWWRAQAYELKGRLDEAIADYRRALAVEPALTRIPFNLADLLERQGRPCEAEMPIKQFLVYHPDVRDRELIDARLERLRQACP